MALIACRECGREISDKALACPQCGAPRTPAPSAYAPTLHSPRRSNAWLAVLGIAVLLFSVWGLWPDARSPSDGVFTTPGSATRAVGETQPPPAPPRWRLVGSQGDMRFVVVEDDGGSKAPYHQAVTSLCAGKTHCFVNFWTDDALAPRRIPMTDAEVEAQVAGYRMNTNTRLSRWGWRCSVFPDTPRNECM